MHAELITNCYSFAAYRLSSCNNHLATTAGDVKDSVKDALN
jgi:hypothetical protein